MKFHYFNLETCHEAMGLVVVIDVIRAFTNAAVAFSRGAREIHPVSTVEEALEFKRQTPGALACGEVGGIPPEGFDFGNSPTHTDALDLCGRIIVQRTSAGTQGIVRSTHASQMVAASFVVAGATVKYIQTIQPHDISFTITGFSYDGGEEDRACAEYLEALLKDESPDVKLYLDRVRESHDGRHLLEAPIPHAPITDLEYCTSIDKYHFAMPVTHENGRFVMRPVQPMVETGEGNLR
jgi:2-phosphosulfolactate phosphatase